MTNQTHIQKLIAAVDVAQKAVIESQANKEPDKFQHAQLMLQQAKQQLHEMYSNNSHFNHEQEKQILHSKELIRQLEETQHAIKLLINSKK